MPSIPNHLTFDFDPAISKSEHIEFDQILQHTVLGLRMSEPVSLLKLPTEILENILSEARPSLGTLKAISQCCHRLHAIAVPHVFKSVVIRTPESMSRFLETAASSHRLTSLIREVQVHYHDLDEDTTDSPEDIEPVLSSLVNLESLVLRSSWFSWHKDKKMKLLIHPQETLPTLRSGA